MSKSLKVFLQDLFLILSAIIGMGFASGKEIKVFFASFGKYNILALIVFIFFYITFFSIIQGFIEKEKIRDFKQFNERLFKNSSLINKGLIFIYIVCASCMLAGFDSLLKDLFDVYIPFSIVLSIVGFLIVAGGIEKIRKISLYLSPILILLVFINLFVNSFNLSLGFSNFSMLLASTKNELLPAIIFPLLFLGGNLILAVNSIINLKSNKKAILTVSSFIFLVLTFLGIVVACCDTNNFMPFIFSSQNLSKVFCTVYFYAIIIALILSLVISVHNSYSLLKVKNKFSLGLIFIISQTISFIGLEVIVKYLYSISGVIGLIYLLIISFKIIKNKLKIKHFK